MAMKMNFDEFIGFAKENFADGGETILETMDRRDFEKQYPLGISLREADMELQYAIDFEYKMGLRGYDGMEG